MTLRKISNPPPPPQLPTASTSSASSAPSSTPAPADMLPPLFQTPLHTHGRYIHSPSHQHVKLCSINWYGGSDILFVPSGLDVRHRSHIAQTMRSMGFNSVRLPYSDELVLKNPLIPAHLLSANRDLQGLRALEVFAAVVAACTSAGLGVVVNNHITQAGWYDGKNLCDASWKNDHLGPFCRVRQTEEQWISHWVAIMEPLLADPLVIGCDLRNEPRGLWGTTSWAGWRRAATRCADRLHALNPDWLMFVEGLGSANDCSGARRDPVALAIPHRVVYSVHVFAWSGWGDMAPFSRRPYPGFVLQMRKNWAFLLEDDVAPVWVAEMGVPDTPGKGDTHYWGNLMKWLRACGADWGYWAINPRKPRENELETWGLVRDDWESVVDDYRMEGLRG
ncbi:MAG: hypothetical protein LQ340_007386, partial [Diploschistes diacapsis]